MIWEIEPVTPFAVKNGNKISLIDLYEEGGKLFRIDTDDFLLSLDNKLIIDLENIFEDFIKIKVNSTKGKRQSRPNFDEYDRTWNQLQDFYRRNKAGNFKIFPSIERNNEFKRTMDFEDIMQVEIFRENRKYLIPYIPGSTLKGLIRRMLIVQYFKHNKSKEGNFDLNQRTDSWKRIDKHLKNAMRYIQVSDFYPEENFQIKMTLTKRIKIGTNISRGIAISMPMISKGKFFGEVNLQKLNDTFQNAFTYFGFSGKNEDIEEWLFHITTENSSNIIMKNRENYRGQLYMGPDSESHLISIGFGKGLSLSGFVSLKKEMNLSLPRIKSGREKIDQDYPKTSVVTSIYDGEKFVQGKVGILRANESKSYRYLKEVKELKYLFSEEMKNEIMPD